METNANHFFVGIFVLIGMIIGGVVLVVFGGGRQQQEFVSYRIEFEGSIQGLSVGSQVTFNGIPVGKVGYISLGSSPSVVDVFIDVDKEIRLREDTQVSLTYRGLTGLANVELRGGNADSLRILPVTEDLGSYLTAKGSVVQDAIDGARNLLDKLTKLSDRIDVMVGSNEANFNTSLANLANFSESLNENTDSFVSFLSDTQSFSRELTVLATNVNGLTTEMRGVIAQVDVSSLNQTLSNAALVSDAIARSSNRIELIVGDVGNITSEFKDLLSNINQATDKSLAAIDAVDPEKITTLISNLTEFSSDLALSGAKIDETSDNILEISAASRGAVESLLKAVEPIQKELESGGGRDLFLEIIKSTRSIGRAASEIADFVANTNQGLGTISQSIDDAISSTQNGVDRIVSDLSRTLERFDRDPQGFFFSGSGRSEYDGTGQ